MESAEGYLAGGSTQRFRRYLETVKESGICWFEPNNGHQLAGSVNTFPSPGPKKCGVLSKGFLTSKSKPVYIPLQMACGPVQVGRGESGLLPDRTQGAGLSRRLAGEVYGLA